MTATDARSAATWRPTLRRPVLRTSGPWRGEALALLVLVLALVVLGLVMSLSASFAADAVDGGAFSTFQRQAAWAVLGLVVMFGTARVDHRVWRPLSWPLLAVALVALVLVVVPGVGLTEGGATRWLGVGPFVLQPSELAKIATLLWLADVAARKRHLRGGADPALRHQLVPALPLLGLIVALVLWFEGVHLRFFAVGLVGAGALTWVAIQTAGYRMARITGWLDPEADPLNSGLQLLQSYYALGNGGWLGAGLGQGRQKWAFLPNPETDFIYAIIGEELGLVGALCTLLLFTGVLVVGLRVARAAPEPFGRIVAAGTTAWLVGQAFLNIGTVTGLVPITGFTLPLVSVGGSSLVSTLFALGILLAIARDTGPHAPRVSAAPPTPQRARR